LSNRPIKTSNYIGPKTDVKNYISDADKDLKNIFSFLSLTPKFYSQTTEPTLAKNDWAFWTDSDGVNYYLLVNYNGTQKKVELT